jgi:hypothetical protein
MLLTTLVNKIKKLIKINKYIQTYGTNKLLKIINLLEEKYGHLNSVKERKPVDANKQPIPWYTYPAIEYLSQLYLKDKEVFEFGSGNSSLFWARKAKKVYSVENDFEWYKMVCRSKLPNQEIILAKDESEYINSILNIQKKFYLIIVDGKYRFQCSKVALDCLDTNGFIILDNSERHPKTAKLLKQSGLIPIDFFGLGPINYYCWTTSIYLKRTVEIQTESNIQPVYGIGSLCQNAESDINIENTTI